MLADERYLHERFTVDELMPTIDPILAEGRSGAQPPGPPRESGDRPTIA